MSMLRESFRDNFVRDSKVDPIGFRYGMETQIFLEKKYLFEFDAS
jgi:hypothetical protein